MRLNILLLVVLLVDITMNIVVVVMNRKITKFKSKAEFFKMEKEDESGRI